MTNFNFLFDLPSFQEHKNPQAVAGAFWRQEIQEQVSSASLKELVRLIAVHLLKKGIGKGDRIVLIAEQYNIKWLATDMAIMASGAISTPLHHPIKADELNSILHNIDPALIIRSAGITLPEQSKSHTVFFEELCQPLTPEDDVHLQRLVAIRQNILQEDIATIVHTSGSSGEPRAVCLSHRNLMANLTTLLSIVPFTPGTRVMSFLPLSHIFERMVCYVYLASGASIYFLDSYRNVLFALQDVRPRYFTCVPFVLERFAAVLEARAKSRSWFTRWAFKSWQKKNRSFTEQIGSIIAQQWIIRRWKKTLGGKLIGIVSGAAYLDPEVERLYERSGIKIRQGYGLTEASPVIAINRFTPGDHYPGTVGLPLPGVQVSIASDGEVLVKGANIMVGYYNDDNATAEVIKDGWLLTGDIGHWKKNDFLVITDRKSNIYKHATGKFISPAIIESKLIHQQLIQKAIIIGFQRPYTIAVILPEFEALQKVCVEKNIHWTAPEYMIYNPMVIRLYYELMDQIDLQRHERIEKLILVADPWTIENGMLTATYKPRRKEIENKYQKEIEEAYG